MNRSEPNAIVSIDKVKALRSSLKAGIINISEIDTFLERIELQLPESESKKSAKPIFHHGKLIRKKMY